MERREPIDLHPGMSPGNPTLSTVKVLVEYLPALLAQSASDSIQHTDSTSTAMTNPC